MCIKDKYIDFVESYLGVKLSLWQRIMFKIINHKRLKGADVELIKPVVVCGQTKPERGKNFYRTAILYIEEGDDKCLK